MQMTYSQKKDLVQKTAAGSTASVLDASSQGESLQRKADVANNAAQRAEAPRPNNTGMPDNLKSGIESLSGFSMDDVRVHYNSSKPATVQALAYTQGTDIHVAPGQEKCLPHEAWHVAQQMAGRVSPTTNINGMPVNDNAALEHEADVMGEKAVGQRILENNIQKATTTKNLQRKTSAIQMQKVICKDGNYSVQEDTYSPKEKEGETEIVSFPEKEIELDCENKKIFVIINDANLGGNTGSLFNAKMIDFGNTATQQDCFAKKILATSRKEEAKTGHQLAQEISSASPDLGLMNVYFCSEKYIYIEKIDKIEAQYTEDDGKNKENIIKWSTQLYNIISAMHEKNVIHGDLHIGNTIITREGNLRLIDFDKTHKISDADTFEKKVDEKKVEIDQCLVAIKTMLFQFYLEKTIKSEKWTYTEEGAYLNDFSEDVQLSAIKGFSYQDLFDMINLKELRINDEMKKIDIEKLDETIAPIIDYIINESKSKCMK